MRVKKPCGAGWTWSCRRETFLVTMVISMGMGVMQRERFVLECTVATSQSVPVFSGSAAPAVGACHSSPRSLLCAVEISTLNQIFWKWLEHGENVRNVFVTSGLVDEVLGVTQLLAVITKLAQHLGGNLGSWIEEPP